jgi:hypothetical protein
MIGDGFYVGRKEADDCLAKEPTSTADCPGTAAVALRPPARIPRAGRKRMFSRHVSFVVSSALLAASGICTASPINGGFESPVVGGALPYLTISVGTEPAGFRWRVLNGTVDAVRQGPEFGATAYEGTQWLDLDGTSPGTLAQTFATVVGGQYTVNFAYANNPRSPGGGRQCRPRACSKYSMNQP